MYHSVGESTCFEIGAGLYCVPVEKFREQMEYISLDSRFRGNDLSAMSYELRAMSLITFDDGLLDNYTKAYPALREFGLKAYFFILAGKVGLSGYMDWQQIIELRNDGMIIGSHGMTHRILTELNDEESDYELIESKRILEDKLRQPIEYFSIPRGFYNRNIIEKLKNAGYTGVFTSNPKDSNGFKFGRIAVRADWDLEYFTRVINNGLSLRDKTKELIKNTSKKMLGPKRYDRVRTRILGP